MRRSIRNFNIPPRAYHGHLTVHCAQGGGNLNVALKGWGIWTGFISCSDVIRPRVFRFLQGMTDFQDRISPLLVNNYFKRSLIWRYHYGISLKSVNSVWLKTKFVFEESYFSTSWWGIWTVFLPRGEGIWTSQSSKFKCPGGCPGGGMLNFRIDRRIKKNIRLLSLFPLHFSAPV